MLYQMPDECLMKRKFGYVYCIDYQAGTKKFTLAGESFRGKKEEGRGKREEGRGKKEEGRGKREEGRFSFALPNLHFFTLYAIFTVS